MMMFHSMILCLLCLFVSVHLALTVLDRSRAAAELRAIRTELRAIHSMLTEQDRQRQYDATDGPLSQRTAQRADVATTPIAAPPISGDYLKLPELGPETEAQETMVFRRAP